MPDNTIRNTVPKSPAQLAYEADVEAKPTYPDGGTRRQWVELGEIEQLSWKMNPTPRWTKESL